MEIQDFDVNSYFVPLNNQLNYSTSFVINNTQLVVNFGYNSRLNQRYFNVVTSGGILLLQNTFIQLRNLIKFNVNFDFLGNGTTKIYFHKKDESQPLDIINWADNIEMYIRTVPPESKAQEDYNNLATWVSDTELTTNVIDELYETVESQNIDVNVPKQGSIDSDFDLSKYNWSTISFDEYPIGTNNPVITKNVDNIGEITSSFFSSFIGQTVTPLNDAYTITGKPVVGQNLSQDTSSKYATQIANDGSNPTSPILSGLVSDSRLFNSPISVLFSKPVHAIAIDGGYFNAVNSTYIEVYDQYGNVIGSNINNKEGIESFGFSSGNVARISGFSFYINANEPAGFAIDNLRIV